MYSLSDLRRYFAGTHIMWEDRLVLVNDITDTNDTTVRGVISLVDAATGQARNVGNLTAAEMWAKIVVPRTHPGFVGKGDAWAFVARASPRGTQQGIYTGNYTVRLKTPTSPWATNNGHQKALSLIERPEYFPFATIAQMNERPVFQPFAPYLAVQTNNAIIFNGPNPVGAIENGQPVLALYARELEQMFRRATGVAPRFGDIALLLPPEQRLPREHTQSAILTISPEGYDDDGTHTFNMRIHQPYFGIVDMSHCLPITIPNSQRGAWAWKAAAMAIDPAGDLLTAMWIMADYALDHWRTQVWRNRVRDSYFAAVGPGFPAFGRTPNRDARYVALTNLIARVRLRLAGGLLNYYDRNGTEGHTDEEARKIQDTMLNTFLLRWLWLVCSPMSETRSQDLSTFFSQMFLPNLCVATAVERAHASRNYYDAMNPGVQAAHPAVSVVLAEAQQEREARFERVADRNLAMILGMPDVEPGPQDPFVKYLYSNHAWWHMFNNWPDVRGASTIDMLRVYITIVGYVTSGLSVQDFIDYNGIPDLALNPTYTAGCPALVVAQTRLRDDFEAYANETRADFNRQWDPPVADDEDEEGGEF